MSMLKALATGPSFPERSLGPPPPGFAYLAKSEVGLRLEEFCDGLWLFVPLDDICGKCSFPFAYKYR